MKNKIRIGIDFDNTIICYDDLFIRAVKEKEWDLGVDCGESKAAIKERLVQLDGNDFRWQEMQAIVYGILIKDANPFSGVLETLQYLKDSGNYELFIVSHKTPASLYLKHITLIDKAQLWIKDRKLTDFIPEENIFFRPVRDEKINVIRDLNLDFFIDDLLEVLHDKNFPPINAFFFSPDGNEINHWNKIKECFEIINEFGFKNFKAIQEFAPFPYSNMETIKRDGNNKIIRFECSNKKKIVLKKYSKVDDSYSTLEKEFEALKLLGEARLPVPKAYFKDSDAGLALYENIEAATSRPSRENIIRDFSGFLSSLHKLSKTSDFSEFSSARDFRDKTSDYKTHVLRRLSQIEAGCKNDMRFEPIQKYLDQVFKPLHKIVLERYEQNLKRFNLSETKPISRLQKILSPSDFGMHNAIYNHQNNFNFIDFEYFGWDDPVKLVADFLHHAGQDSISQEDRLEILKNFAQQSSLDADFFMRLSTILDLVGLEWILIILNIANPEVLQRRMYANPELNIPDLLEQRLKKARERADLFHTNIASNSVFLSLKSIHSKVMEIPAWQQLIT